MPDECAKVPHRSGPADEPPGPTPPAGPPLVSFAAPSGTGKTTLLELVIAELTRRGHRIGAVKHDAHRIELDTEGKDSWRLRRAGAADTLLMGRDQLAWFGADGGGPTLEEAVAVFHRGADLVLVEGYRSAGLPTIVVHRPDHRDRRAETDREPRWEAPDPERVLATVHPDDVDEVVDLLERRFLSSS